MNSAIDIIKHFEGRRLEAYRDPAGVLTIGYGHTTGVVEGATITEEQAEKYLGSDLYFAKRHVKSALPGVIMTSSQLEALASFVFNVGAGSFRTSTMRAHLMAGQPELAAREFGRWIWAGGKPLRGLVLRRAAEMALFAAEPFKRIGDAST